MRRIKISVFFFFFLFAVTFFGHRWMTPPVSGETGGSTALAAPTDVTASDGNYANKVGLRWDTIRGATVYRIFRNTTNNPGSAADVGTTPANYFFDETAQAGQNYFYWVRAENIGTVSALSVPDQGMRGNGTIGSTAFPPLEPPIAPDENPVTATKAYLGKTLFWDEQISSTRTMACGTCHRSAAGGSDPRTIFNDMRSRNPGVDNVFNTEDDVFGSPGVVQNNADGTYSMAINFGFNEQVTPRKAPSYLNAGYTRGGLFWDGRATDVFRDPLTNQIVLTSRGGLESQVLGPPVSSGEMAHVGRNWSEVAARVVQSKPLALASNIPPALAIWIGGRTYPQLFQEAFGTPEVTPSRIAMAIATHERTLFSDQTPLDKSEALIEPLTVQEESGKNLFINLQCNTCHDGSLLTDNNFHNIGVRPTTEDPGRGAVSGDPDDNGRFKTPNLRNLELRAPYMHNGRFQTLEDVVEFYNRGGDYDAPNIDHGVIRPLNLFPQEKADLAAFLKRPLTDLRVSQESAPFDRPQLYSESSRVPVITGTGRAGSGSITPQPLALEPPLLGNPSFTVAVSRALGSAQAVLVIDSADPGVGSSIPSTGSFLRQSITLQGSGAGGGFASLSLQIPNDPALLGQTFFGRWYITDAGAANGFSVTPAFRLTIFGQASAVNRAVTADFDGDHKTDLSIFRPANGQWWYLRSSDNQNRVFQFGSSTDKLVPADYTGDGKVDVAVWRPSSGEWFILRSEDNSFYAVPFGLSGDTPMPGDYDGDGRADQAVFRASSGTWYIQASTQGTIIEGFGVASDVPQAADYDGDGRTDIAIYRPSDGQWWLKRSTQGVIAISFGSTSDKPIPADYTGDGKADVAIWRPSTGEWFILRSEDFSYYAVPFGVSTDIPAPGDYDGDGRADTAVFREGVWYVNRSTQGILIQGFGTTGDYPAPAAFIP